MTALLKIAGVGPALAKALMAGKLTSAEAIANLSIGELSEIPGIGARRAPKLKAAAAAMAKVNGGSPTSKPAVKRAPRKIAKTAPTPKIPSLDEALAAAEAARAAAEEKAAKAKLKARKAKKKAAALAAEFAVAKEKAKKKAKKTKSAAKKAIAKEKAKGASILAGKGGKAAKKAKKAKKGKK